MIIFLPVLTLSKGLRKNVNSTFAIGCVDKPVDSTYLPVDIFVHWSVNPLYKIYYVDVYLNQVVENDYEKNGFMVWKQTKDLYFIYF